MAVGVQFLIERARQRGIGAGENFFDRRHAVRKVLLEFVTEPRIAGGNFADQQRRRHAEGLRNLRRGEQGFQRLQGARDMLARRLRAREFLFAHRRHRRAEHVGDALPHGRDRAHHRHAKFGAEHHAVDIEAAILRLVHLVQCDDQRAAELREFQRQFEMAFERGRIDHLNDDVRRRERHRRTARFVARHRRAIIAPQQILEGGTVIVAAVAQRMQARQRNHARLVKADLNRTFVVRTLRADQRAALDRGAGDGIEQRALAAVGQADQRDAQPPLAAEQRVMQGHPGGVGLGGRLRHRYCRWRRGCDTMFMTGCLSMEANNQVLCRIGKDRSAI